MKGTRLEMIEYRGELILPLWNSTFRIRSMARSSGVTAAIATLFMVQGFLITDM
ncbi:MAG: hypothetical protein AB9Q22_12175 [Candidatus Reddybacter sp.]